MIKTLLNADEEPSPKNVPLAEEKNVETLLSANLPANSSVPSDDQAESFGENASANNEQTADVFEIPDSSKYFTKTEELADETEKDLSQFSEEELEKLLELEEENYKNLITEPVNTEVFQNPNETILSENKNESSPEEREKEVEYQPISAEAETPSIEMSAAPAINNYEPETPGETIRKTGLAYSAAMVLLASVVFMMILGWFADLLLGSAPWGIVGGIILGAIIGFIQFFRIASSIFKQ